MEYAQLRNLLGPLVTGLKDAGTTPCCRRFARKWACLSLVPPSRSGKDDDDQG